MEWFSLADALSVQGNEDIIKRALQAIQWLLSLGPLVAASFVPYYSRIVPFLNQYRSQVSCSDGIVYSGKMHLADMVAATLFKMEEVGGEAGLAKIRQAMPVYEPQCFPADFP